MSIGPSMPLRLEKPEGIDLAQAARYFGARGGADAATQALLEKCAVPLLAAATPRAVWLEADPDSLTAAGILAGEDVAKHLEGCTAALLLAALLGLTGVWLAFPAAEGAVLLVSLRFSRSLRRARPEPAPQAITTALR